MGKKARETSRRFDSYKTDEREYPSGRSFEDKQHPVRFQPGKQEEWRGVGAVPVPQAEPVTLGQVDAKGQTWGAAYQREFFHADTFGGGEFVGVARRWQAAEGPIRLPGNGEPAIGIAAPGAVEFFQHAVGEGVGNLPVGFEQAHAVAAVAEQDAGLGREKGHARAGLEGDAGDGEGGRVALLVIEPVIVQRDGRAAQVDEFDKLVAAVDDAVAVVVVAGVRQEFVNHNRFGRGPVGGWGTGAGGCARRKSRRGGNSHRQRPVSPSRRTTYDFLIPV